ncbi:MAG TPA: hypothetical protein VI818_06650 [Candidatus Thermoplasmatota archaeon]|nr:hypothetical protein [Candidatus Thermoplasmatota archaeon]
MVLGVVAGAFISLTPTAAAHDPECAATLHQGPAKVHVLCEPGAHDESDCVASVKVLFVHQRAMCE